MNWPYRGDDYRDYLHDPSTIRPISEIIYRLSPPVGRLVYSVDTVEKWIPSRDTTRAQSSRLLEASSRDRLAYSNCEFTWMPFFERR